MPDLPKRPRPRAGRRRMPGEEDQLFRHIVSSMRNGVLAVHRNGTLALMNNEAYRIFSMTRQPDDIGRPFTDVLRTRGDVVRVLTAAFELNHLPNRAELRLKELDRVIGYTLSQVKDDAASTIGPQRRCFMENASRRPRPDRRPRGSSRPPRHG